MNMEKNYRSLELRNAILEKKFTSKALGLEGISSNFMKDDAEVL